MIWAAFCDCIMLLQFVRRCLSESARGVCPPGKLARRLFFSRILRVFFANCFAFCIQAPQFFKRLAALRRRRFFTGFALFRAAVCPRGCAMRTVAAGI
ncbi:MAG: hypothetical protein DBX55_04515 [Verrucomicrobia bacterium]|nr:MAG: hypothetical protein DBX55_04515 [Verrucomicrobiota bacterium]